MSADRRARGRCGGARDASRPAAIDLRGFAEAGVDARASTRLLAEALRDDRRRRVYLVGFRPAADLLHPADGGSRASADGEADAWRRLFERMETVVVRDGGERASASRGEQSARRLLGLAAGRARVRFLAEELGAAPRLRGLADRQLAPAFAAHDREAMVARLAEIADYYATCGAPAPRTSGASSRTCARAPSRGGAPRAASSTGAFAVEIRWCGP